jgi:hypothetical protein
MGKWLNDYTEIIIGPDGTQADIADAIADVEAAGNGRVKLMGTAYTATGAAGTVAFSITKPGVEFDLGGATITYTGAGVCLRVRMDPFTITNAGAVRNGTIDGTGSTAGAVGIETGCVVGHGWEGVNVNNFSGAGSINWWFNNAIASTWMERCRFSRCDSRNGRYSYRASAHASSPSFLYNDFSDCRFDTGSGQTFLKTDDPTQIFDSYFGFRGNVNDGGTVFDLAGTSLVRPTGHFTVEQTNGLTAVLFAPGSDQIRYPRGTFEIINFPAYDTARQVTDYEDRGELVTFDPRIVSTIEAPLQGFGLSVGVSQLGTWTAVYDGGVGSDFALLKVPFGGSLATARVAAQLDSVTRAEIGFKPGAFTSGSRPAATAVPVGTMIYITDVSNGIPVWSDGTVWRNAAGVVA